MTTQINSREDIVKMIEEIASFYNKPGKAMNVMEKYKLADRGYHGVKYFLNKEKTSFLSRMAQGVKKLPCVEILEAKLDNRQPVEPIPGYSLGLAAYQAEMLYHGGRRFTE